MNSFPLFGLLMKMKNKNRIPSNHYYSLKMNLTEKIKSGGSFCFPCQFRLWSQYTRIEGNSMNIRSNFLYFKSESMTLGFMFSDFMSQAANSVSYYFPRTFLSNFIYGIETNNKSSEVT